MRHLDKSKRRDKGDIGSLFFVESTDAVADALGVEIAEIPLTPWRVLASLRPT